MRKLLNTLFITSPDAYLTRDGLNVVVRVNDEARLRLPIHNLEGIMTMGYTGASPALMHLCAERGVALSFHSETGRLLARLVPANKGNVLLRKRQYALHDDPLQSLAISRSFVLGKLANSRTVLRRYVRDYRDEPESLELNKVAERVSGLLDQVRGCDNVDSLRGIEGDGARRYYSVFNNLIRTERTVFLFGGRSRRPPLDRVNALLSFLYSVLANDCASALEMVGLDPQVGFYHRMRPGRASLALDLMEELRPYLVDRLTLSLINNRQIEGGDFVLKETGAVFLREQSIKLVINAWQSRKRQTVVHPYLQETIEVGLIPYVQALLLARFIRGDIDGYPPYTMS